MSKNIGRCGRCGYGTSESAQMPAGPGEIAPAAARPQTTPASAPTPADGAVVRFEGRHEAITPAVADAYHRAALAGAEMVSATRTFEQVRNLLQSERDALKLWSLLDQQIGAADPDSQRPAVIDLRDWFERQLFNQQESRLVEIFKCDPDAGWNEWMRLYAEALARWRIKFCEHLIGLKLDFPQEFRKPHDFTRATRLLAHERWPEVYSFYSSIAAREFLRAETRARLTVTMGFIHLYYFNPIESALNLFKESDKIAPHLAAVQAAIGDYHRRLKEYDIAANYLQSAVAIGPDEVEGYIYSGDLASDQGKFEDARNWYQEAINRAGGDGAGYVRLLRLYGRPEFIGNYESNIVPLAQRAIAVSETSEYRTYLDVGDAYGSSKRYDSAQQWYQKAVELDPARLDAYIWKGFSYLEQGAEKYEDARHEFSRAVELAPESYAGYWGMAQSYEREQKWQEAANWYGRAVECQPELRAIMLFRMGDALRRAGQYQKAAPPLLEALKQDPSNDYAILELADDYYKKDDNPVEAVQLLDKIRSIKGGSFEANHRNRIGNVYYYKGQYQAAAAQYLKAIEADPGQAVYYSNLAGACKNLKQWADARGQFDKALEINGDKKTHDTDVALVYNEEGNANYSVGRYDAAAECYTQAMNLAPDSPRYPSNRALALSELAPSSENALELLDRAVADARKAEELARNDEEFSRQVSSLEARHAFAALYGGPALALTPVDERILVQVQVEALPTILNPQGNDLSPRFKAAIEQVRADLQTRYGLVIPPVRFYDFAAPGYSGLYQIKIMGQDVAAGVIEIGKKFGYGSLAQAADFPTAKGPGLAPLADGFSGFWLEERDWPKAASHGIELIDPLDFLVRHLANTLNLHVDKVCGHQETADLLARCNAKNCAEVRGDPRKLHSFQRILKEHLKPGGPAPEVVKLCEEFERSWRNRPSAAAPPDPPTTDAVTAPKSITLRVSPRAPVDRAELVQYLSAVQSGMFQELGIIVPPPALADDDGLDPGAFELQLGEERLAPVQGLEPGEFWVLIPYEDLRSRFSTGRASVDPNSGQAAAIVKGTEQDRLDFEKNGVLTRTQLGYFLFNLGAEIRRREPMAC